MRESTTAYFGDLQHGGGGGAKALRRVAHRGRKNMSAAPVTAATGTQGSITFFLRQTTLTPPDLLLLLQRPPLHSSPTSQR